MKPSLLTIGAELEVNRLGYGAMRLTGGGQWGEYPDREGGIALLRRVVEAGITFIDTADAYGPHTNEVLIHDALHPYAGGLVIATKGGFVRGGPGRANYGAVGNREYLRQCAYLSARRLGLERIDLYYLHRPYATDVPFVEQVTTLAELREEGVIRHIGLSNVSSEQFLAARELVEIAAVTARYNLADRTGAALLAAAEDAGVAFCPWFPTTLPNRNGSAAQFSDVLGPICERHDASVPQVAIAWLLHRSPVMLPIPGTTSRSHLEENIRAASIELTAAEVTAITQLVPEEAEVALKLSVVIPSHDDEASVAETVQRLVETLERERVEYEIVVVVDDANPDRPAAAAMAPVVASNPAVRRIASHHPPGFGFAVRSGLDDYTGDAVAIVMADGCDSPDDLVAYQRLLEEGYDCAFGSRFVPGSVVTGYPRRKLTLNRAVNWGIRLLFRHGYNDTTNAFKAYRRGVIDTVQPLLSGDFSLTVELPLKAIVRGHSYGIVPISWTNRSVGASKLRLRAMGSRYLSVVLHVLLEHHLSRGEHRSPDAPAGRLRLRPGVRAGAASAPARMREPSRRS